jgi:hypothetical protein
MPIFLSLSQYIRVCYLAESEYGQSFIENFNYLLPFHSAPGGGEKKVRCGKRNFLG